MLPQENFKNIKLIFTKYYDNTDTATRELEFKHIQILKKLEVEKILNNNY